MISATARGAGGVDPDDRTGLVGRVTGIAGRVGTADRPTMTGAFWFGAASLYLVALAVAMSTLSFDVWGGLVVAPVLTVVTVPVLQRIARADPDPAIGRLLLAALAVKLAGTLLRYAVTFEVYSSGADAVGYHGAGVRLAAAFWRGSFAETAEAELPELTGTPFVRLVTTVIYVVIGPTQLGGFMVFSWLSFWGMLWFYRAAVVAFPGADHRRYAVLLFFLPAMVYWPSSIGKEAWMLFTMGLASYGVALVLRHEPLGYTAATLGLLGTAMVRPHVTALIFLSLFVAYLLRRRSWRDSALGPVGKAVGVPRCWRAAGWCSARPPSSSTSTTSTGGRSNRCSTPPSGRRPRAGRRSTTSRSAHRPSSPRPWCPCCSARSCGRRTTSRP